MTTTSNDDGAATRTTAAAATRRNGGAASATAEPAGADRPDLRRRATPARRSVVANDISNGAEWDRTWASLPFLAGRPSRR